ncbi:AAA family ATPase [Haloferax volcanii]|uniref:ORC1-type DNA replication protein n=1 Tax=Haloferax volcanii TaxID=2246 RepID=A0A6C0UU61_HALVO|nr:AAA family ATPase [Haloferax alexandrinus]QIB79085.1 AAA family ATPase [Haloferax alexandrinus]
MKLFNTDTETQVFRNRDSLQDDYVPDELAGDTRDDEMQQLATALQPIITGDQPDNVLVRGPNGSGKTAAVRVVLNILDYEIESIEGVNFSYVIVNGSQHNTGYQLTRDLANKLHPDTDFRQGHSYSALLNAVAEGIKGLDGAVVVAIDELSDIDDVDKLLYLLTRSSSNDALAGKQMGVVATTTDASFKNELSPHVKSTIGKRTVKFDAYTSNQLREVLNHRVEKAFAEGSVDESAISLCAALATQQGGDARFALDLLKYGGDIANRGDGRVTETEINQANDMWAREHVDSIVSDFSLKERQVLCAYMELCEVADVSSPRTAQIVRRYQTLAGRSKSAEVVSDRTVARYLQSLVDEGLLRSTLHQDKEGTWREYEPAFDSIHYLDALRSDVDRDKIAPHEDLVSMIKQ